MVDKPLLVLDLDETLVSSVGSPQHERLAACAMPFTLIDVVHDNRMVSFAVFKRPFLDAFLRFAARHYRLALWSAGEAAYVNGVYEAVLRPLAEFEFVWTSAHCVAGPASARKLVKNLASIGGANLARMLLVDNMRASALMQPQNHIGVPDFVATRADAWRDNSLPELAEFLEQLVGLDDVRTVNKTWWRTTSTTPCEANYAPYHSVAALHRWRHQRQHRRRGLLWTEKVKAI